MSGIPGVLTDLRCAPCVKIENGTRRKKVLTQERSRELFDYHEAGYLIRRSSTGQRALKGSRTSIKVNGSGYQRVRIDGVGYQLHLVIYLWHHGYFPEHQVDHRDQIKTHNWISNLREVTQSCNRRNCGNSAANASGIRGVHYAKRAGRWQATIGKEKLIWLGYFEDLTEAVAHRLAAEQCLGWEGCDSSSPAYKFIKEIE